MGHPARQPPHRFHLLRLAELGFEQALLGDVFGDALEVGHRALGVPHHSPAEPDGDGGAVLAFPLHFQAVPALQVLGDCVRVFGGVPIDFRSQVGGQQFSLRIVTEHGY